MTKISAGTDIYDQTLSFTDRSWEAFYGVIENNYFLENEAEAIYEALRKCPDHTPFRDYLKRYIYRAAGLEGPFRDIPDEVYRGILMDSFRETGTPPSFSPTTARLSALAKNWLTQTTVGRNVVLLLGFGLKMTECEVNEMLVKALQEQGLNEEDPTELICAFCYRNGFGFPSYERLSREYREMPGKTPEVRDSSEAALMLQLKALSADSGSSAAESTRKKVYRSLYEEAQELIAAMYSLTGYPSGFTAADITEADLEHVLSSAIPTDRHGNLLPASASSLGSRFSEHRISRQRLNALLSGRTQISRYDLITLSFFLWSQKKSVSNDPKRRYIGFIEATNRLLKECAFGEIYPVNPYECFLLMCLLSDTPLSTYADVWELAYTDREETP